MVGRVWPRHSGGGRPLNSVVSRHPNVTTSSALPKFKYHPDPVSSGVIVEGSERCPCCNERRGWEYVGPWYSTADLNHLCPWCIANGAAAAQFEAEFGYSVESGTTSDANDELRLRTPWHFTAQEEKWPVHCGDFCAVLGRVTPDLLATFRDEIEFDLAQLQTDLGLSREELNHEIGRDHSPLMTYIFQCLRCGKHRLNGEYE
jgi:uncharacterized protein CbrC (UPF0167 family)